MEDYKNFCIDEYKRIFAKEFDACKEKKIGKKRVFAQKKAIKESSVNAMMKYPKIEPANIWKTIYLSHINNFSQIFDKEIIDKIISADNSWKKSSGHAFEEMIRDIGNLHLKDKGLRIFLQKELSVELHNNNIKNEVRDISWLKEQTATSIFDLYLAIEDDDGFLVYGCIQSKTSVRDRVTRDREPSINAMKAYFMSIAIVLDGDFLKMPKFKNMVNGNSNEFDINGWHKLYVLSNNEELIDDRISIMDISMKTFVDEAEKGANYWLTQRQWLNSEWRP